MVDPEQRRQQIYKLVKWAAIAAAFAISYPVAYFAVQGLLFWAVFAGLGLVIANFAPAFADLVSAWRFKAIVAIAEANPIETMQSLFLEKNAELRKNEENITAFETEYRNVNDLVEGLRKTDPDEAIAYGEMRDQMKTGLIGLRQELSLATAELDGFQKQIEKARRIYKVAQAMNKALEKSATAQAEVFSKIKEQVAFDKVRSDLNRAFSNLNTAVERRKNSALFETKEETKSLPAKAEVVEFARPIKTPAGIVVRQLDKCVNN